MVLEVGNQVFKTVPPQRAAASESSSRENPSSAQQADGKVLPPATTELPDTAQTLSRAENLEAMSERLNQFMQARQQHSLLFSLDDSSGRPVIQVINKDTDEIVKQFPPEELLSLSRMLQDSAEEAVQQSIGVLLEEQI